MPENQDPLRGCRRVRRRVTDEALRGIAAADQNHRARGGRFTAAQSHCHVKVTYGYREAHRVARILRDEQGDDVRAYPCPGCGQWHVGHPPAPKEGDMSNEPAERDADVVVLDLGGEQVVVDLSDAEWEEKYPHLPKRYEDWHAG